MPVRSGEQAHETGQFHCANCGEKVLVRKSEEIPTCPNCGSNVFDSRTDERDGS